jgi:hypothetical protein
MTKNQKTVIGFIKQRIALLNEMLSKGNYAIDLPDDLQNEIGMKGHINGLEKALDTFNIYK